MKKLLMGVALLTLASCSQQGAVEDAVTEPTIAEAE